MLVSEVLERPSELHRRLKIFGTDLDESSLAVSRRAVYSRQAMSNLPDDRDLGQRRWADSSELPHRRHPIKIVQTVHRAGLATTSLWLKASRVTIPRIQPLQHPTDCHVK
jgi:hypothetical protein